MSDWSALKNELATWRAEGRELDIWWRDDDAVAPTRPLDQLLSLADKLHCPVHLAVIPAGSTDDLALLCAGNPLAPILVHGWAQQSHSPEGEKKAEFGAHRALNAMVQDAKAGLSRLQGQFGASLVPAFVPPWNRISPELVAALPSLGYLILSTYKPRKSPEPVPGLSQINTHLDPIEWRGSRSLVDEPSLVNKVSVDLARRRLGLDDASEPYGVLTHHLVHDRSIWDFTERLLAELLDGGAQPSHIGNCLAEAAE